MITLVFGLVSLLASVTLILNIQRYVPATRNENVRYWCDRLVEIDGKSLIEVRQAVERFHPDSKRDELNLKMCKLYLDF